VVTKRVSWVLGLVLLGLGVFALSGIWEPHSAAIRAHYIGVSAIVLGIVLVKYGNR
jgi:Na+-transporting NADH:ubiquinone oxidoreductase subunit NqrB